MPDVFEDLFPDSHYVVTLEEIATSPGKSYKQAREAQHTLSQRAAPFRTQAHVGNIKLVRGDWIEAFLAS